MGCDIHSVAQRKDGNRWITIGGLAPFDRRDYGTFGFLAGVRNYSAVPPIAPQRGLPNGFDNDDDEDVGEHSFSWLSVDELASFDYDQEFEDRRISRQIAPNLWSGGETAEVGGGQRTTYRAFLGPAFFDDLEQLRQRGAERIVFGFDS